MKRNKVLKSIVVVIILSLLAFLIGYSIKINNNNTANIITDSKQLSNEERLEILQIPEGYSVEEIVVLSRHNIRSPLTGANSDLENITTHQWPNWSRKPDS